MAWTLKSLTQATGVGDAKVRKAFWWWCKKRNLDPLDFMKRSGHRTWCYNLPEEFVNEFLKDLKKEKKIFLMGTHDGSYMKIIKRW